MRLARWAGGLLLLPALMGISIAEPVHAQAKKIGASDAPSSSEQTGIRWRVENTFRFFKNPSHTQRHRKAFVDLETSLKRPPTISEVERYLALQTAGRGWAEAMVASAAQDFCWWRHDRACQGYARPMSHRVLVSATGAAGTCEWRRDGAAVQGLAPAPCNSEVAIDIPYPQGARVSVTTQGRTIGDTEIKVRDVLIVSMGDSFASGEGNPDKPVRFTRGRIVNYGPEPTTMEGWDLGGYPAREGASTDQGTSDPKYDAGSAQWLHRGCHRSLYSQHVRMALHLAISDPTQQRAVTYIGVACTGARISYGLFGAWSGVTNASNSEWEVTMPQISGISRAICATAPKPVATPYTLSTTEDDYRPDAPPGSILACPRESARTIDLVLLSIGGNDVGFSRLVARASLKNDAILDAGAAFVGAKPKLTVKEATSLLPKLESNYRQAARAIREVLHVEDPKRVILTAYPPMAFDEHGQPCRAQAPGMDVTPLFGIEPDSASAAEGFVDRSLLPVMSASARTLGWTYVDEQRASYKAHGVCALGGEPGDPAASNLGMPRRRGDRPLEAMARGPADFGEAGAAFGRTVSAGTVSTVSPKWRWLPYEPDRWRPYMPRTRWFRSPNDAFLTVNLHEPLAGNEINLTRFAAYSGAFHPTAQGHAATADAVYRKVEALRLLD